MIFMFFVSFFLEGMLSRILPMGYHDLSLFTPHLVLTFFLVRTFFYQKEKKSLFFSTFLLGLCYSFCYHSYFLLDPFLFLLFVFLLSWANRYFPRNLFTVLGSSLLGIVLYEVLSFSFYAFFHLTPFSLFELGYKIVHSLLLNLIYAILLYFLFSLFPKKKRPINEINF